MTKPSRKRTASKSRRKSATRPAPAPKPVDVVTTAPEPQAPAEPPPETQTEELKQEIAKFDHDGGGHVGGSLPHTAEQTDVAKPPAEPADEAATEPEVSPDTTQPEVVEPVAEAEAPAPAAPFEKCMVGPVEARVGRVPLGAVLGLLSPDGLRRIEAEKSSASFESTCKRLLATDGRATPVVFSEASTPDESPSILHGYAELAAAEVSGATDVTVLLIPAGGASEAQTHIVEMVRQQQMRDQPSNDDELFYRVHADE